MKEPRGIKRSAALPFALLILAILVLAIAGYGGYVLYPRFKLPPFTGIGLFVLAAAAGIASFFSPCSFPLLVTLLARPTAGGVEKPRRLSEVLRFSAALSLGASMFLLLTGAVIALGGTPLFAGIVFTSSTGRIIRTVVGLLLISLGLIQTGLLPVSFHAAEKAVRPLQKIQARLRRRRPVLGYMLFGFIYILAGFG